MDLERIKQNLRLRSKRPKKPSKPVAAPSTSQVQGKPTVNGDLKEHTHKSSKSTTSKGSQGQYSKSAIKAAVKALPQISRPSPGKTQARPHLPHAATDIGKQDSQSKHKSDGKLADQTSDQNKTLQAPPPLERSMTETQAPQMVDESDDNDDFDLNPPAPRPKPPSIETLSDLLFSAGHLNSILHDPQGIARFTAFLNKFKPEYHPLILKYLETQKAIKAVEYANAIAEGIDRSRRKDDSGDTDLPSSAANLSREFTTASQSYFETLVGSALPMYITYDLVKVVTECLINEITGRQTPVMRGLVGGLSEAFCITDPKQEDNPIIYASEEFYRLTGYGTDDVIGKNCRFLQGQKTKRDSQTRLRNNITKGEEICETILNYCRDGRPFVNLLMVAPLHDDKGKVKYNIGAQVDVSGLVEGGRGLEDFSQFLISKQRSARSPNRDEGFRNPKALNKLRELSEMLDFEEAAVVQSHSRASSISRNASQTSVGSSQRRSTTRRIYVGSDSEPSDDETEQDRADWKLGQDSRSGKLPGVYESYMLVRPAPSMRIIFMSPKLRQLGNAVQKPLLSRVAAPAAILAGLKESFASGIPVSAKVHFMTEAGESRDGTQTSPGVKHEDNKYGRACWISATPLLGSDDKVGVWMIVVVEKSKARRSVKPSRLEGNKSKMANSKQDLPETPTKGPAKPAKSLRPDAPRQETGSRPIKPRRIDDRSATLKDESKTPPAERKPEQPVEDEKRNREEEEENKKEPEKEKKDDSEKESENGKKNENETEKKAGTEDIEDADGNDIDSHEDDQFGSSTIRPNGLHDDEYVHHHEKQQGNKSDRIHIQPDSEEDSATESNNSSNNSTPNNKDMPTVERKYTPPPEIPASMRLDGQDEMDDEDDTPTKDRFEGDEDDEEEVYSTTQSDSKNPNRRLYMNYSRKMSDYTTGRPNSALARRKEPEEPVKETESDHFANSDCARSPYSVD